jgi:two-component system, OmpR family, catabolic regulation response regulator CreB
MSGPQVNFRAIESKEAKPSKTFKRYKSTKSTLPKLALQNIPLNPTILIVEDDAPIAAPLTYALETEGFAVSVVGLIREAKTWLATRRADWIVLDVGLPDGSGFEFCRELRAGGNVPVLMLTARGEMVDRIVGLELGADDYVTKPFSPREVSLRVRTILRRSADGVPASIQLFQNFTAQQRIQFSGVALDLTRLEYHLLLALMKRPGAILSRDSLLSAAWGESAESTDRTVDTHIKTLRAKLKNVRSDLDPIETHRGMGYSLRAKE